MVSAKLLNDFCKWCADQSACTWCALMQDGSFRKFDPGKALKGSLCIVFRQVGDSFKSIKDRVFDQYGLKENDYHDTVWVLGDDRFLNCVYVDGRWFLVDSLMYVVGFGDFAFISKWLNDMKYELVGVDLKQCQTAREVVTKMLEERAIL